MTYFSLKNILKTVLNHSFKNKLKFPPNFPINTYNPTYYLLKQYTPKWFKQYTPKQRSTPTPNFTPIIPDPKGPFTSGHNFNHGIFLCLSLPFFKSKEVKREEELVTMMKMAVLASQRGEMGKAEQLLHVALKTAQEFDDQQAITYIYDLMANFALQNGEFKKAETLFVDVLKRLLRDGMSDNDNAIVDVSLKLASIYSNLGDLEKACQGFRFCIGTQETKLKDAGAENVDEDTLTLWAMSHDWFARFLLQTGHYEKAKAHFLRAYDVCVEVKGSNDPQAAVLLNDLGSVCCLQQDYDQALDYMTKAIEVAETTKSYDLASFYVNLGTIHLQRKVFEEAEVFCSKGMKIAKGDKNDEALKEAQLCLDTLKELKMKK